MVTERYSLVARLLHWLMALLVSVQIGFGFAANWSERPLSDRLLEQHVRLGVILFLLVVMRLSWRVAMPPPALPPFIGAGIRRAAAMVHRLLYGLLLLMPVTGYVLWAWTGPTLDFWGLGRIPILFRGGDEEFWRSVAGYAHEYGAWLIALLAVIHICGALYHELVARDLSIGARMGFGPLDAGSRAD